MRRFISLALLVTWLGGSKVQAEPTSGSLILGVAGEKEAMASAPESHRSVSGGIHWETWSEELFERARKENRLVLLDLEAIWCHWCHVMDEKTYSNPQVARILKDHFICVKVDQDSRPDLSNRYEDYGWPATVFFGTDGRELAKRRGFIRPDAMVALLKQLVKSPVPEKDAEAKPAPVSYSSDTALPAALREELVKKHLDGYDDKMGAWGFGHKFLDWDSVELAIARAGEGKPGAADMARQTLVGQLNLIDPVWGGVYQYSTDGDWEHKHFEKIMQIQGENLKAYAMGYMFFNDPQFLKAAREIERYLRSFLMSPDGAFYTSQDADLKQGEHSEYYFQLQDDERRKLGIPRIDKHIYARENGWAINGLAWLYMATGETQYLDEAGKAARWVAANRSLSGGGFSHDAKDAGGPFLGDTLYMGRAFLTLYQATGDRIWLTKAREAADFIEKHFKSSTAGYLSSAARGAGIHMAQPLLEENINLCRFANLLYHYCGSPEYKAMAENCMKYLATPEIARIRRILVAGILLCDRELGSDPAHMTVVGAKDDPQALSLFQAANRYPVPYKRVEWLDHKEGPLPNSDVEYPEMPKAAAFACANGRCSRPVYTAEEIGPLVDRMTGAAKPSRAK